ncbi:MAG: RNA polymerase sigma factor [Bacteroidales bacterium]|nr:RNA polymerase sigma factor [Bacteroidales bacterium]
MTIAEYNKSVDDFSDGLYRFVLKNTGNEDKAKDIIQDTYEKLWMRISFVNYEKVKSYLYTTAYHTMIDILRKEKRFSSLDDHNIDASECQIQYTGIQEVLNKAITHLPADQKSVILLRDYEGYSYEEIAELTGLSESQVKVYIFRGRMFLKNYLGSIEALI